MIDAVAPLPPAPAPRRRLLRIGLRGVMALVLLAGAGLGWVAHLARVQREAVAAIEATGGSVAYEPRPPARGAVAVALAGVAGRVDAWLGPDYRGRVTSATLGGSAGAAEVAAAGRLRQLRALSDPAGRVRDADAAHLAGLADLDAASFGQGSPLTGRGLAHLAGLARLASLHVDGPDLADADLAVVARMGSLGSLSLSSPGITDAGLAHLAGLTRLYRLDLNGTGVAGPGLAHVRGLPALRALGLARTRVGDLAPLAGPPGGPLPPRLQALIVSDSPIGDAGLAPLADFPALRTVMAGRTAITDAGVAPLARLPHLRQLGLSHTAVTDATLDRLDAAPGLAYLSLAGAAVTDGRVARFRRDHPQVRVAHTPRPEPEARP